MRFLRVRLMLPLAALLSLAVLGCGGGDATPKKPAADKGGPAQPAVAHDHSGWWCTPHGLPEEDCAMCNSKLAAEYKAKGDWCKEHDRPESLCFKCNPERAKKYAALYKQRYKEDPPPITD